METKTDAVGFVFGWGRDETEAEEAAGGVVPPTESSAPEAETEGASLALELMLMVVPAVPRRRW